MGDGRAEASSALGAGAGGQRAVISLIPDVDATHMCIFGSSQLEGYYCRGHTISAVTNLNIRGTANLDWGRGEGFRGDGA